MAIYSITSVQKLPISLDQAWAFLSSPHNLKTITPPHMGFKITNEVAPTDTMFAGQIIVYKLSPLKGYTTEWVTEITHVKNGEYFIDEQRFGPYALWHHKHSLTPIEGGVLMHDIVHYKLPLGFLGRIAHALFVKKQIQNIFDYRTQQLELLFGIYPAAK
jgi:ligand-binding SRPBCC domain-containing protein